ncbi:MAG TPA: mandelate racemase/muconate lactonizing enzyme family protein [Bryobacteraceae bacterium]|jgi:L-alanine-DL-glutamate epimerase-like enolase superfamily enzyme|nr:mandelate racemase/muconate lactonizing enzyme family protein [Bryobacteraceae bacterium]
MSPFSRRQFLQRAGIASSALLAADAVFPAPFAKQAADLRRKVKITDVKCMIVRGTWDWNLIRIETDAGLYGIGEAYWGWGVKDLVVNKMKGIIVGEDPLNVDKLYTKMLMDSAGAGAIGGATITAASGIEIALWDLAGRILQTPSCNLLGGRFRDKVRFYRTTQVPKQHPEDLASWRDLVRRTKAERWGWTAFKFQGDGIPRALDPEYKQPGHDRYLRNLKSGDIRQIVRIMETIREELGPDADFAIDLHWHYDVRDAVDLAKALESVHPMWIEDPVPPENPETMALVRRNSPVPVCTGENLYGFAGFEKLIELQGCDGVHIDIPKSGGLLESKRISDFASSYGIWTAAHNPASPVGTIASAHAASAMRNFRIHELANWIDWWPELVLHDGPIWEGGYLTIQDKPGYGIEINPDVARAHLAPGESWWA